MMRMINDIDVVALSGHKIDSRRTKEILVQPGALESGDSSFQSVPEFRKGLRGFPGIKRYSAGVRLGLVARKKITHWNIS